MFILSHNSSFKEIIKMGLLLNLFACLIVKTSSLLYPYQGSYDEIVCVNNDSFCSHQLPGGDVSPNKCFIARVPYSNCIFDIQEVFDAESVPFHLHAYQHIKGLYVISAVNISFPGLDWKWMLIQFTNIDYPDVQVCRGVNLDFHTEKHNSSIYWDCPIFHVDEFENNNISLKVQNEENVGGEYLMRMPSVRNIDPINTDINDWDVFFYIHSHLFESTGKLRVTIFKAPFQNVTYRVISYRCADNYCNEKIYLNSVFYTGLFEDPASHPFVTLRLSPWMIPGHYIISVEMESNACKPHCRRSFSPLYEKKEAHPMVWLSMLLLIFGFVVIVTIVYLHIQRKNYKKLLYNKKVLLVYHSHCKEFMNFVNDFASILEEFHTTCFNIDKDLRIKEDPNEWTKSMLEIADKVLFLVPKELKGDGVSPIKGQWKSALWYYPSLVLQKNQHPSKFAAIILPWSSKPDKKISHLKTFILTRDFCPLLRWLHNLPLVSEYLFIRPFYKSNEKNVSILIRAIANDNIRERPLKEMIHMADSDDDNLSIIPSSANSSRACSEEVLAMAIPHGSKVCSSSHSSDMEGYSSSSDDSSDNEFVGTNKRLFSV